MATRKQEELKGALANAAENRPAPQDPAKTVDGMLRSLGPQIQRALPKHMTADRLARIVLTTIRQTPKLLECTRESLMASVMLSAQLGLEPGPLGHAYFVPFWDNRSKAMNVQFQIGYKGMLELVRRSGEVQGLPQANEVYERDFFECEYGTNARLIHKPFYDGDRGPVRLYYAHAKLAGGGECFYVMSKSEVESFRDRYTKSKYQGEVTGPWATEFDAMAKKTVLKQMMKYMPLSIELQKKLSADETIKTDITEDMTEAPGVTIEYEYNSATNEVTEAQQQTAAASEEPGLV